jgi:hypothetical protein
MLESAVNMSAIASSRDNPVSARQVQVGLNGHRSIMSSGSLIAPSTISLAMMREAFKGLLADTEMSISSAAEQRDVLERSASQIPQIEGTRVFVSDEKRSYQSVLSLEEIRDLANTREARTTSPTQAKVSNSVFDAVADCHELGESR